MAVITRIELVNYLCEGWQPSMGVARWRPLWPANTLRLAGQSTAIQVPNGGGKTSVTNAILFLLSRDRQLKKEFLDRCAPTETGYTHVRIEFAIRTDENITQRELITIDPRDCPAQSYVIGVCANRGHEDLQFYRHAGTLEESPAYRVDGSTIVFTPNEEFRNRVRKLPKGDWNQWSTIREWSKAVSEFMSPEVVRQNVVFHRSGAGDASAAFNRVVVESGERFDEAYFRQVAAPQLLANLMGESAEEDERTIEDTITISMTRFIDAKLKVERKQAYLQRREAMEAEFAPVLSAADAIEEAQSNYQRQLQGLSRDAAFLERFAGAGGSALPGVPRNPASANVAAGVKQCLVGMALDKDGTVLIADDALAQSLGLSTGHMNQLATRGSASRDSISPYPASSQVIVFACDSKFSEGYGGRRNAPKYYDRAAALGLAARRAVEDAGDYAETLQMAFEAAEQWVDSNPFRREHRHLTTRRDELKAGIAAAEQAGREAEARQRTLEAQVNERAENHAAYQEFCQQAFLLPETLRVLPLAARDWVEKETEIRNDAITRHSGRVGELTAGWKALLRLRNELGLQSPADRLAELEAQKHHFEWQHEDAQSAHQAAQAKRDEQTKEQELTKEAQTKVLYALETLKPLANHDATFRRIFGDVDPLVVSPPVDEIRSLRDKVRKKADLREPKRALHSKLRNLKAENQAFCLLFGNVDPCMTTPLADRDQLSEAYRSAELAYSQHQPHAEALELHIAAYAVDPTEWIRRTDAARLDAQQQAQEAADRCAVLQRELAALDDLSLVDDAVYANAHSILADAGVSFIRLRDFILENELDNTRSLSLLTAFGPLLSAPVLCDLVVAESAMQTLQAAGHEVPLLLREPLLIALHGDGVAETTSGAAVMFMAGARTRRVRAILDPQALEEEKCDIGEQLVHQTQAREQALRLVAKHEPHSEDYRRAIRAQEAVQSASVAKVQAAKLQLQKLVPQIERAQELTTGEALRSLAGAIEFHQLGADAAFESLTAEIETLSASIEVMDADIAVLEERTAQEAVVAHDGAVRLARGGGIARITALETEAGELLETYRLSATLLVEAEGNLDSTSNALKKALQQVQGFLQDYALTTGELKEAIVFENDGSALFMEDKDRTAEELEQARDVLRPLTRVSFTRAQTYMDHEGDDEMELQRGIAEAGQARGRAAEDARTLAKDAGNIEGLLVVADRTAETLHELAYVMIEKRNAVAPYLMDLNQFEGGTIPSEAHPMYARAEELHHQLMDWRRDHGSFERTLITEMRVDLEGVDVGRSGLEVRDVKKRAGRAREYFQGLRDAFCKKAGNSDAAALSQAEIEAIQSANTIEQLHDLVRLGERLRADLELEHSELQELQESVSSVESESIETLTRLVESCRSNLATMNKVMAGNQNARFFLEATIISNDDIKKLLVELRDGIEERKRFAESRTSLSKRDKDDSSIRADVRRALIDRIFTEPSVQFRHIGMWDGKTQPIQASLSEGQKAALQMMWLIKESEYHLECVVRRHLGGGSKKKLRSRSQRILFFDGLFSNLSDRTLIDEAFKGLGEADSNLQLIGLIHNTEYRNNPNIFPSLVIGRRAGWREVDGERSFIRFEDGRPDGSMGLATFMVKMPSEPFSNGAPYG